MRCFVAPNLRSVLYPCGWHFWRNFAVREMCRTAHVFFFFWRKDKNYKTLRSQRTEEVSERAKAALQKARGESDTAWRGLIDSVNLRYFYEQDAQLVPFMRYMNTEIDWYRTILGQKPGNPDTNFEGGEVEDGGGAGTETDVQKYTVAWYQPNGNPIVWYELAPGETIPEAPECPDGYYWHPYPATMPDHDLDIIPERIRG